MNLASLSNSPDNPVFGRIFQMLLQIVLTDTMRVSYGENVCLQSGMGGRNERENNQLLKVKFDRFLKILRESVGGGAVVWLVFLCLFFFFKRTSVIAPSWNSYVTKFFKSGRGKCIATMVTMQLKGQGPV